MWPVSLEALEGLTGRLLALGLIHALWIGLLAAALAAIGFQALPGLSRRTRHRLLISAFGAVAIGPVLAVATQRASASSGIYDGETSIRVAITRGDGIRSQPSASADVRPASGPDLRPRIGPRLGQLFVGMLDGLETGRPLILASWLVGTSMFSARLMLGALSIRRLVRSARPAPETFQARADALARRLELRRTPRVLVHPGLGEPCLCGIFRPMILLPGSWLGAADPSRIEAILAHELAHARRLDLPVSLAQRLVETGLFFHPAVHWLSRSLRRERERCADALAVRLTGDPFALASALESVARNRLTVPSSGRRSPTFGASLGGENFSLLPRIQELLGMTPTKPARRSIWPWLSLPVGISLALLGASLGLAQDPPKVTPAVPAPSGKSASPVPPSPLKAPAGADSDREISYEFRFLSIADPGWRERMQDRMREVHREGGVVAWIVHDRKSTRALLTSLRPDPKSKVLQAPKVTTFEGARATISPGPTRNLIAELQKLVTKNPQASVPITRSIEMGSQVDLSGKIQPSSILLTVDLFDTCLNPLYDKKNPASLDSFLYTSHSRLSEDVPDGASLLISQGLRNSGQETPSAIGPHVVERMVLITPKAIRLEAEKKRVEVILPDRKSRTASELERVGFKVISPPLQYPESRTASGQTGPERSLRYFNFSMSAMY